MSVGSKRTKEDAAKSKEQEVDQEGEVKDGDLKVWERRNAVLDKSMATARVEQEEGEQARRRGREILGSSPAWRWARTHAHTRNAMGLSRLVWGKLDQQASAMQVHGV